MVILAMVGERRKNVWLCQETIMEVLSASRGNGISFITGIPIKHAIAVKDVQKK